MKTRAVYLWVSLFAIAMGFLECAVVIYLRDILYPGGFAFPLASISQKLAVTELFREAATLLMLLGAGILAGRTATERFAWFLYAFALWDIFYYVFLWLLLGWPASLLTWDVLFLIPVTWTGPVLSPVLASGMMIVLGSCIICATGRNPQTVLSATEWILLITGATVVFISFIWDYSVFILHHYSLQEIWAIPNKQALFNLAIKYIPDRFPWLIFGSGMLVIASGTSLFARRTL